MKNRKPLLTTSQQIEHLKHKGITFNFSSDQEAFNYLKYNNNFFKLSSYRKNYDKNSKGKYINLDFGYLKDLAIIDMKLRYTVVQLALTIEHYAKMELLRTVEDNEEDGYRICNDFLKSLDSQQRRKIKAEIKRNKNNPYCGELFKKYNNKFPVWVFLEMISFGRLVSFYRFCANRYSSKDMMDKHFLLKTCKEIRNASAHSSCILNNLRPKTNKFKPSYSVMNKLAKIKSISNSTRIRKMSNSRIVQIVTLLYTHNIIVTSEGVKEKAKESLYEFKDRMNKNICYYENNPMIQSSFIFLGKIIDNWYK